MLTLCLVNVCYDFVNGWNDAISSLAIENEYQCVFFENFGCHNNGQERCKSIDLCASDTC
jgi:hypothetical protein